MITLSDYRKLTHKTFAFFPSSPLFFALIVCKLYYLLMLPQQKHLIQNDIGISFQLFMPSYSFRFFFFSSHRDVAQGLEALDYRTS